MKKLGKIIFFIFTTLILLSLTYSVSYAAASTTLEANSTELTVGDTATITVGIVNTETWNLSVTADGGKLSGTTSNTDANGSEISKNVISCEFTATEKGTYTITLTGTVAGSDLEKKEVSKTIKITVKEKEETPVEKPDNTETPSTGTTTTPETEKPSTSETQKPTVTEPKFTEVNKTMYATVNMNLRDSWSTSSKATEITKGTELKVTGTSSEKVNGYIWSRVNYNGQTKYVASYLITSTKPEEEKKSDNAYLKSLTIEGQELLPAFSKDITTYTIQVGSDVTELNVKTEAEDSKATVSIEGNKDLKEGANTVTVSVNAEDNTIKIYEITVTKAEKIALGLKSLNIKDTGIEKEFKTDLYNYEIDIKDVTKLEIEAVANDEKATVEILGNEDLQDGENTITIIVSSENGEEKVTYQIKANKELVQKTEEITQKVEQTKGQISSKVYLYIALGAVLLIALVIVIVYVIEHRNQEDEFEYSDNFEQFPGELPNSIKEENNLYDEEMNIEQTNLEETKPLDVINEDYQKEEYQEMNFIEERKEQNEEKYSTQEEIEEDFDVQDRKAKIDYFLDDAEEDIKPKRRKGKHF